MWVYKSSGAPRALARHTCTILSSLKDARGAAAVYLYCVCVCMPAKRPSRALYAHPPLVVCSCHAS